MGPSLVVVLTNGKMSRLPERMFSFDDAPMMLAAIFAVGAFSMHGKRFMAREEKLVRNPSACNPVGGVSLISFVELIPGQNCRERRAGWMKFFSPTMRAELEGAARLMTPTNFGAKQARLEEDSRDGRSFSGFWAGSRCIGWGVDRRSAR